MQMYNCRWCGLSLADKSSSKGQPSWQPSWHPTSKLWATTISYQTFGVLEIKWWCRNNPETFDGYPFFFLWGLCGLSWAELSCEMQPDTRRLAWRVSEESSFVSGGRLPLSPPPNPQATRMDYGILGDLCEIDRRLLMRSNIFSLILWVVVDSYSLHFNFDVASCMKKGPGPNIELNRFNKTGIELRLLLMGKKCSENSYASSSRFVEIWKV